LPHSWQKKGNKELAANPSYIWACAEQKALWPLTQVPEVEEIFAEQEGRVCSVMIVVPRHDEAVLEKIFAVELEVVDNSPDLEYDFTVISRDGRPLADLVTPAGELMFSKV
jgi:hypothetical protein